jgi:hypothetical protein
MRFRIRLQLAEALGHVNRWYCSQCHGQRIDDPNTLLIHFIKNGGAKDFARRYEISMGSDNRWYCSEFHGREINDPQMLWDYYMRYGEKQCHGEDLCRDSDRPNISC